MRILRIRAYSEPEQFTGLHMMRDLDSAYADAGFVTDDLTPMPTRGVSNQIRREYRHRKIEKLYGGHLITHRFNMFRERNSTVFRMLRYILCNIVEYFIGQRFRDADVLYSSSTPPTQGYMCAKLKKKLKVPFIYELQDVFPDSLVTAGMTSKDSLIWKLGRRIERKTYQAADKIIVISDSMKNNLLNKGVPEEKMIVIPNWVDTDVVKPVPKEENVLFDEYNVDRNKFNVVYAGNFGEVQGTEVILKAAELLEEEGNIHFVLFGAGTRFEETQKVAASLTNVSIFPILPQERVSEVYSLGNIALITCKPGTGKSSMPSKTWSIMACNTPIIAAFDQKSEFEEILTENEAGICVPPGDEKALAEAIRETYASNYDGMTKHGAREYVIANASKKVCTERYIDTLKQVCLGK